MIVYLILVWRVNHDRILCENSLSNQEAMLSLLDDDPDENTDSYAVRVGSMKRKQLYDKKVRRILQR